MTRADAAPILLAHSSPHVQEALRDALSPREVLVVHDAFAAAAEVARATFGAIVLEHPLLGMDAPYLAGWLRDCGATAPFVVIAEGLAQGERFQLSASVGGAAVVGSTDAAEIRVALKLVESGALQPPPAPGPSPFAGEAVDLDEAADDGAPTPAAEPFAADAPPSLDEPLEPPVVEAEAIDVPAAEVPVYLEDEAVGVVDESDAPSDDALVEGAEVEPVEELPSVELPEAVVDLGPAAPVLPVEAEPVKAPHPRLPPPGVLLALKTDDASFSRWMALNLPFRLVGLLDGTRDGPSVVAEASAPTAETTGYLATLFEADCLEVVGKAVAAPDGAETVAPAEEVAAEDEEEVAVELESVEEIGWRPPTPDSKPTEEGELSSTPAPELLLRLARQTFTGSLHIATDGWIMRVDLMRGQPVRASGGPEGLRFGEILAQLGHLNPTVLGKLLAEQRRGPSIPLGDLAIRERLIDSNHVLEALEVQIDRSVHFLVGMTAASYRVYRHAVSSAISEPKAMHRLVAEGLQEHQPRREELVASFLSRHASEGIRALEHAGTLLPEFRFGARVQRLIRSMDGTSIAEVLKASPIPRSEAEAALYLLWSAGAADLGRVRAPAAEETSRPSPAAGPRVEYLPTRTVAPSPRPAAPPPDPPPPPPSPARIPSTPLSRDPSRSSGWRDAGRQVQDKLELAAKAMEGKSYAMAIDLLTSARAIDGKNPQVLAALGWAIFRSQPGSPKAREQARACLAEALNLSSDNVQALLALGKIERLDGEFDKAREAFDRVLQKDGDNADAKRELESLDELGGRDKDASGGDSSSSFLANLFRRRKT